MTSSVVRPPDTPPDSGDPAAESSRAWAAYADGIRFLALRLLGDADAADDVAQETMLRAWRTSTDPKGHAIHDQAAFVHGIARHVIADFQRRSAKTVSLDTAGPVAANSRDALDVLVSDEERSRLRTAMRALSRSERALLMMSYVEGMTSAAIAQRLGESAEAIRKRKSRAVQQLRDAFRGA